MYYYTWILKIVNAKQENNYVNKKNLENEDKQARSTQYHVLSFMFNEECISYGQ